MEAENIKIISCVNIYSINGGVKISLNNCVLIVSSAVVTISIPIKMNM